MGSRTARRYWHIWMRSRTTSSSTSIDFRSPDKKQQAVPAALEELVESSFERYKVNVFVTQRDHEGAPVIRENNPNHNNLIGKIEFKARFGFMTTDHNMIRPGAIHRANGGYLVLQALDVLVNPFSWDALKRVLRAKEAAPESWPTSTA